MEWGCRFCWFGLRVSWVFGHGSLILALGGTNEHVRSFFGLVLLWVANVGELFGKRPLRYEAYAREDIHVNLYIYI